MGVLVSEQNHNENNHLQNKGQNDITNNMDIFHQQLLMLAVLNKLQQTESELQQLSHYDPLTHLANRAQFEEELKREIARAIRFDRKLGLISLDVDFFKKINDNLGHEIGDNVLKEVAHRLRSAVRTEDIIAHTGGDEFAAILTEIGSPHDAGIVAHRIVDMMSKPFEIAGNNINLGVSIGIACFPEAGKNAGEMYKNADIALTSAKNLGRGNYQFFTVALQERHAKRLELEAELHFALERNEFYLEYQPRFELASKKMVGMEALLRWKHPSKGIVAPSEFIPIAEETGLIVPIGRWVLQNACKQYGEWKNKYNHLNATLAVNVSPRQFQHNNFINWVMQAVEDNNIQANNLELEITESAVTTYLGRIENNLFQLRNFGVQFSIDDFGTGYSSLSRLKELPIQAIKIDQSFVNDIDVKQADNMIIKSTLVLAKNMGLNVVAEGVETENQLRFLEINNCPQAQGYYYSKPLSIDAMEEFIKTHINTSIKQSGRVD